MNQLSRIGCLAFALALSACNSGNNDSSPGMSGGSTPARGALLQTQLLSTLSASNLLLQLENAANAQIFSLSGSPTCDVKVYHIEYETVGGTDEATTASGALMVPTGSASNCTGNRPILLYAHGTTTDKGYNIADLTNQQNAEGLYLAAFFASQGYIVVAPNYAGYDTSTLPYHPFLNADQQSKDMIDALSAARSALPTSQAATTRDGGKLFITGYSQGGHVAMATHRAMQAAGMTVTASAPMSGPYALGAFVDAIFEGEVNEGAPVQAVLLLTSYQNAYSNVYSATTDVYETQYATGIGTLFPSTSTRSELYSEGKLPQYALFSSTAPTGYAAMTPATTPTSLAPVFAQGFGSGDLINNNYRTTYLNDAIAHPDGGFPTLASNAADLPSSTATVGFRQDTAYNDLRDWTPTAPVQMCGGDQDPTVFFFNTTLMADYWSGLASPPTSTSVVDLETTVTNDPYSTLKSEFAAAKTLVATDAIAQGATDGGAAAIDEAYHTTLVAPFCVAATRALFDSL